ncbi:MAG: hypothetical protein AAF938_28100, partial [Myxococcota bacterium]
AGDEDSAVDLRMPDLAPPDLGPPEPPPITPLEQGWYLTRDPANDVLIDFRTEPPTVTCEGVIGSSPGFEGTAVFTDPETGDLLLYSDGDTILNGQTHAVLENGTEMSGDSSCTEAALVTPVPGGENAFYLFTNDTNVSEPSSLSYSIIELDRGPNGTVTEKNVPLITGNPGEALDVVPHTNGTDFWVLAYASAAEILAFPVSEAGVGTTPVRSSTGLSGSVFRASINHTEDFDTLVLSAVTGAGGSSGFIATSTIDRTTGRVAPLNVHVDREAVGYQASISPDGTKIYFVIGNEGFLGEPHQFDLTTNTLARLSTETLYGGSKLAPDGRIYWVANRQMAIGVVEDPDAPGAAANFQHASFDLGGCLAGFGVPNQTAAFTDFLPPLI